MRQQKTTDNPHIVLVYLEYACIGWFTFEYLSRLVVAPEKCKFIKASLNVIDLFTILPFYMELCLPAVGINADKLREITGEKNTGYHKNCTPVLSTLLQLVQLTN
jgi:hypothetical protein